MRAAFVNFVDSCDDNEADETYGKRERVRTRERERAKEKEEKKEHRSKIANRVEISIGARGKSMCVVNRNRNVKLDFVDFFLSNFSLICTVLFHYFFHFGRVFLFFSLLFRP